MGGGGGGGRVCRCHSVCLFVRLTGVEHPPSGLGLDDASDDGENSNTAWAGLGERGACGVAAGQEYRMGTWCHALAGSISAR